MKPKLYLQFLFFLAAFLFCSTEGFSQTKANQQTLEIFIGPSFPTGEYGGNNAADNAHGLAKTGGVLGISYNHFIQKKLGISLQFQSQLHPGDNEALANSFNNSIYRNWKFESFNWFLTTAQAGLIFQQPLSSLLTFYGKCSGGILFTKSPKINGTSQETNAQASITQSSRSSTGFAYGINTGFQFKASGKFSLFAGAEYFSSEKLRFGNIATNYSAIRYSNGTPVQVEKSNYSVQAQQKFAVLNFKLGVNFQL